MHQAAYHGSCGRKSSLFAYIQECNPLKNQIPDAILSRRVQFYPVKSQTGLASRAAFCGEMPSSGSSQKMQVSRKTRSRYPVVPGSSRYKDGSPLHEGQTRQPRCTAGSPQHRAAPPSQTNWRLHCPGKMTGAHAGVLPLHAPGQPVFLHQSRRCGRQIAGRSSRRTPSRAARSWIVTSAYRIWQDISESIIVHPKCSRVDWPVAGISPSIDVSSIADLFFGCNCSRT